MMEKKPHKHAELIKAWADGAEIQYKYEDEETTEWVDLASPGETTIALDSPTWEDDVEYRLKPEPKPDVVEYFNDYGAEIGYSYPSIEIANSWRRAERIGVIKRIINGETGKVTYEAVEVAE